MMQGNRHRFDAAAFWEARHARYAFSLRAVGHRRLREAANRWSYRRVREAYEGLLSVMSLGRAARALDAGAGTGEHLVPLLNREWNVVAVDVAPRAVNTLRRRYPAVESHVMGIADLTFPTKFFDLVQCFDVLYHIVDEREWLASIERLCDVADRYVVLHGAFPSTIVRSQYHVRLRTADDTLAAFHEQGFTPRWAVETLSAFSIPWVYFRNVWPAGWYVWDRLFHLPPRPVINRLPRHGFVVFERQTDGGSSSRLDVGTSKL